MMNRRAFVGAALASTAGLLMAACARKPRQTQPTIREIIDSNASFSTLARALSNAGVQSLGDRGPFTVFAPRNSAFEKLPAGELDRLLQPANRAELLRIMQLHVVPGTYPASALVNRTTTLTTAGGLQIIVDGFNGLHVGGVNVVQPDVMASNGVVHVIDGVLLPPA
jgi:uncharacterized surface protein with fasciclin (FAS1) repeats